MSFVTQNGLVISCDALTCTCNRPAPVTAGGLSAENEERWFSELCDAIEEYLHLYVQHRESPKADRDALNVKLHEAKTDIVARFYASGWVR